jgi:gliding motility-associated-like protein
VLQWVLVIFFTLNQLEQCFAQGTSNEGTDFWVAYAGHVDNTQSRLTLFLTSKVNATVTIDVGGQPYRVNNVPVSVTLIANQPKAIYINPLEYTNVYVQTSDNVQIHPKKGIHITSDKPIVVYSHISRSARSAACLVYPTKALGSDYYAISYTQLADQGSEIRSSQFTIVGIEDGTEIEITPSQSSRWQPARAAGVPFTVMLNKGDIYQFQSITDITGSRIRSATGCKPFAVFSGSTKNGFCEQGNTSTPNNPNGQDNLYQQLLPTAAWGKNFVTSPSYNATKGNFDIYRIQVLNDNTTVTVNGSTTAVNGAPLANPYAKGSVITFHGQSANVISANGPINVAQFQTSQSCNPINFTGQFDVLAPGDPEMIILNPIEQTLKDITVYSAISTTEAPTNIRSHYINAIIKTADAPSFTVDGLSFPVSAAGSPFELNKFMRINDEYSYIIVDVTVSSESGRPTHRIRADGGFVAIAYGYGVVESYGYLAGSDLRNLNQFIQPESAVTNTPIIGGCSWQPLKLYVLLPYQTQSLKWDIGNGSGVETDPDPKAHFTTQTINGEILYKYRYFKDEVTFSAAGIYTVKAMVVNPNPIACDENEVVQLNLTVSHPPTASFTASVNKICEGGKVTFSDQSVGNGVDINKWYWDFGDGTPVEVRRSAQPFEHTFANAGDYEVTLITEGLSGCQSKRSPANSIHVIEPPRVRFSYELCDIVKFTDETEPVEGAIVKWTWDFDDPESGVANNTSNLQSPTHLFSKSAAFNIRLTVETDQGCKNTYSSVFYSKPTLDAGDDIVILRNGEKQLNAVAEGVGLKYRWVPAAGLSSDTIPNPIASPLEDTKYTLTVASQGGCETVDELFVKVLEPEIPNAFSPNNDQVNDKWAIRYLETYVRATVKVFNRYGQVVYSSGQYVSPWDGTYNGKEVPSGVYYYIIEPNNGRKRMAGSITLLR